VGRFPVAVLNDIPVLLRQMRTTPCIRSHGLNHAISTGAAFGLDTA
jgi:hypothetical protein